MVRSASSGEKVAARETSPQFRIARLVSSRYDSAIVALRAPRPFNHRRHSVSTPKSASEMTERDIRCQQRLNEINGELRDRINKMIAEDYGIEGLYLLNYVFTYDEREANEARVGGCCCHSSGWHCCPCRAC